MSDKNKELSIKQKTELLKKRKRNRLKRIEKKGYTDKEIIKSTNAGLLKAHNTKVRKNRIEKKGYTRKELGQYKETSTKLYDKAISHNIALMYEKREKQNKEHTKKYLQDRQREQDRQAEIRKQYFAKADKKQINEPTELIQEQLTKVLTLIDSSDLKNKHEYDDLSNILSDQIEGLTPRDAIVSPSPKNQLKEITPLIHIDWMETSCEYDDRFNELMETWQNQKGAPLQRKESYSNRAYQKHYIFYWYDLQIFDLYYEGQGAIKKETAKIKFANWIFYHEKRNDFLDMPFNDWNLIFKSFSRLDVALDFEQTYIRNIIPVDKVENLVSGLINKKFVTSSRIQMTPYYKGGLTGVSFGKSPLRLEFYDKARHLRKVEKPYISEIIEKHFGKDADVWRLELQMRYVGKSIIEDSEGNALRIDIETIKEDYIIKEILNHGIKKRLDIRLNENKRLTRCTSLINENITSMFVKKVQKDETKAKKMIISGLLKDSVTLVSPIEKKAQIKQAAKITKRYKIVMHFLTRLKENDLESYLYVMYENDLINKEQTLYDQQVLYPQI